MPKGYPWVRTNQPGKPTDMEKRKVEQAFASLIATMKAELPPLEEPQEFNQCVDLKGGWRGSYYTLKAVYKCPPTPTSQVESFDTNVARLTYLSKDQYALAYFRHTEKWHVIFPAISLAEAIESIKSAPMFEI